jgi:O-antigen ligase
MSFAFPRSNDGSDLKSHLSRSAVWLLRAVIAILCLAFFVPFIVSDGQFFPHLLFPYVTGKSLVFRLLVEALVGFYLLLILREPKYLPRASRLAWIAFAFVAWGGISVFTSVDPAKSFWSNTERMDGYLTLLHLFAYFLIVGSVISVEEGWKEFFQISLIASTLMALCEIREVIAIHLIAGRTNLRMGATFGTPTYLSVYLLFGVFIGFLLIAMDYRTRLARWAYSFAILVQLVGLYYTQTRGALLGLVGGVITAAGFIGWHSRAPELQHISRASRRVSIVLALLIAAFVAAPRLVTELSSGALSRIASISLEDGSTKLRLHNWEIAWQGFLERPVFGWGQENFNAVVKKFDNGTTKSDADAGFDRAHNQFLDWLIAGGLPMFLLYASLFAAAAWNVARANLSIPERGVLFGLLAAYCLNNLVVFDNLVSAMYFWLILAFVDSFSAKRLTYSIVLPRPIYNQGMAVTATAVVLVVFAGMWGLNRPGYARAQALLDATSIVSQQTIVKCSRVAVVAAC